MKKDILDSLSTIKPLLDGIAKTIAAITDVAIKFGKVLVENLDRVATYVIVAAAAFSGKFVAGLIAARVATFSLAGAFAFLRKAIIRTGIGAIIVLVAEAVLMFGKLSKAVGGVGPLLELLKDAFFEILGKIAGRLQWLSEMNKAAFYQIVLNVLQALRDLLSKVNSDFVNKFIGYFAGAIAGAVEYIKTLPSVFVEVFKNIKMAVANGINAFTGLIGQGINYLREKLRMEKLTFKDVIDTSKIEGGNVTGAIDEAVGKIGAAVKTAVEKDYVGAIKSGLTNTINETNKSMQKALKEAVSLDAGLKKPTTAVEKLKEAFAALKDETSSIDVTSWFTGKKDKDKDGKSLTDALTEAQQRVQDLADTIKSSMSNGFMAMIEGTKSVKDAFKDMAREIIKKLYEILVVQQIVGSFDAKAGTGSGIVGAIMGAFSGSAAPATSPRPKIRTFADGGVLSGPTMFPMAGGKTGLMGEAGPEAIMPLKRGANGKLGVQAEGGGSTTVVQNFNFQANGDDSVKRIIAQAAPQIANMTKKSMLDDRRRGGQMKATFG
jgi:lambda family phage tail tape measure protein